MTQSIIVLLAVGLIAIGIFKSRNGRSCGIASIAIAVAILAAGNVAYAQEHQHHGAVGRFYESWMMPDNRSVSCCNRSDCNAAESKFENGKWMARQVGDTGSFTSIPPHKVEHERDSPDGRSHLCGRRSLGEFTVFCYLPAAGG